MLNREEDENNWIPFYEELCPLPGQVAPFAATSDNTIDVLLTSILKVEEHDVVLDLGCGDGRVLIEAAARFKCRGIGVDVDPSLTEKAQKKAEERNVSHLLTFKIKSFMDEDFSLAPASIIVLYLLPECLSTLFGKIQKYAKEQKEKNRALQVAAIHFNFEALTPKMISDRGNIFLYTNEELLP